VQATARTIVGQRTAGALTLCSPKFVWVEKCTKWGGGGSKAWAYEVELRMDV
jgi:hypothetical protein